jgi:hypothetical protein
MAENCEIGCGNSSYLERVRYFQRQLITADDMRQEQEYFIEKLRRHNRYMHGWGIVCGLAVKSTPTSQAPLNVTICPGYALGPYGDEIYIGKEVNFDLATCSGQQQANPCDCNDYNATIGNDSKEIYLAIKYAECLTRPQRALPADCGCDETGCEFSRVRDSIEISCLNSLPYSHTPQYRKVEVENGSPDKDGILACPLCPDDPWLVLAKINLETLIPDYSDRRNLKEK